MATQQGTLSSLEATLQEYLVDKAPFQIPQGGRDFIVTVAPWLIIISSVLALPAIFALFGFSGMMGPTMMRYGNTLIGPLWYASLALMTVAVVLDVMALPGLFARTMQGWRYVFYAQIVSIISSLLQYNLVGAIIGGLIGFYVLFQVKSMYK